MGSATTPFTGVGADPNLHKLHQQHNPQQQSTDVMCAACAPLLLSLTQLESHAAWYQLTQRILHSHQS
jgi:hypothetical protein